MVTVTDLDGSNPRAIHHPGLVPYAGSTGARGGPHCTPRQGGTGGSGNLTADPNIWTGIVGAESGSTDQGYLINSIPEDLAQGLPSNTNYWVWVAEDINTATGGSAPANWYGEPTQNGTYIFFQTGYGSLSTDPAPQQPRFFAEALIYSYSGGIQSYVGTDGTAQCYGSTSSSILPGGCVSTSTGSALGPSHWSIQRLTPQEWCAYQETTLIECVDDGNGQDTGVPQVEQEWNNPTSIDSLPQNPLITMSGNYSLNGGSSWNGINHAYVFYDVAGSVQNCSDGLNQCGDIDMDRFLNSNTGIQGSGFPSQPLQAQLW